MVRTLACSSSFRRGRRAESLGNTNGTLRLTQSENVAEQGQGHAPRGKLLVRRSDLRSVAPKHHNRTYYTCPYYHAHLCALAPHFDSTASRHAPRVYVPCALPDDWRHPETTANGFRISKQLQKIVSMATQSLWSRPPGATWCYLASWVLIPYRLVLSSRKRFQTI